MTDPAPDSRSLPPASEPPQSEIDVFGSELKSLEQQARTFVQQQPIVAVLAAVGIGYLIARLASRGNR